MGIYSDWVSTYAENGLFCIPCTGDKRPVLTNWTKFCTQKMEEAELLFLKEKYQSSEAIGLPLGPSNGIVAFDFDYKLSPKHIDRLGRDEWLRVNCLIHNERVKISDEILSILPKTPCFKRGDKDKWTAFFRAGPGIKTESLKRNGETLFDLLYEGRQTILPPSPHNESSSHYEWQGEPLHLVLDSLPVLTGEIINLIKKKYFEVESPFQKQTSGRNDILVTAAYGMFRRGASPEEAALALQVIDEQNHASPLFSDRNEFPKTHLKPEKSALSFARSNYKTFKTRILNEVPQIENDSYTIYKAFFEQLYPTAKRELFSGQLIYKKENNWLSVQNQVKAIRSHAISRKLRAAEVDDHLSRYVIERKKEFVVDVPKWDGFDRIHELKDYIEVSNVDFAVFEDFIKAWGAGIQMRMHDAINQNVCPILLGSQNLGKDYLVNKLSSGYDYYYAGLTQQMDPVEIWRQVTSKAIIHIPEFDQTGAIPVAVLKDYITRIHVDIRPLFKEHHERRQCVASFISTSNNEDLFRDPTGNRRFAVFQVANIIKRDYPANWSDQVMAQFFSLTKDKYKLRKESALIMEQILERHRPENPADILLEFWDERVSALCVKYSCHELKQEKVALVLEDMSRYFGWRVQAISNLLRLTGRKRKTAGIMLYTCKRIDLN